MASCWRILSCTSFLPLSLSLISSYLTFKDPPPKKVKCWFLLNNLRTKWVAVTKLRAHEPMNTSLVSHFSVTHRRLRERHLLPCTSEAKTVQALQMAFHDKGFS